MTGCNYPTLLITYTADLNQLNSISLAYHCNKVPFTFDISVKMAFYADYKKDLSTIIRTHASYTQTKNWVFHLCYIITRHPFTSMILWGK